MAWWERHREVEQAGSVLFRGSLPPRLENFSFLEKQQVEIRPQVPSGDCLWSAALAHPRFGQATLTCPRRADIPPPKLIDFDPRLTPEERENAKLAGNRVSLVVPARTGNVLRDRKDLLWFLDAVMADDGLVAMDQVSLALWSQDGLDDELLHDADLDIDAVYSLHLVSDDAGTTDRSAGSVPGQEPAAYWLHSHGFRELGFWDFDILSPSADYHQSGFDTIRALAFAVVEEKLKTGGTPAVLAKQATICAIPARECLSRFGPGEYEQYRSGVDDDHLDGHAIICDPLRNGFLARLLGLAKPRPSMFFQEPVPEELLIYFSNSATALMARRARQTVGILRGAFDEFRELELPALVKLGYVTDGGGPDDREHLWFEVHSFDGETVDATLVNQPYAVSSLKEGQRGIRPLDLLSDWTIMTPAGHINPRQTRTLRYVRAHFCELREAMEKHRPVPLHDSSASASRATDVPGACTQHGAAM